MLNMSMYFCSVGKSKIFNKNGSIKCSCYFHWLFNCWIQKTIRCFAILKLKFYGMALILMWLISITAWCEGEFPISMHIWDPSSFDQAFHINWYGIHVAIGHLSDPSGNPNNFWFLCGKKLNILFWSWFS